MASKIIVDQLESSGSNITIPTGTGLVVTDGIAATNLSGTIADARLPTVPVAKGGTGLTSLGSANQQLRVNSGGNALEFATIAAPSSDFVKIATGNFTNVSSLMIDGTANWGTAGTYKSHMLTFTPLKVTGGSYTHLRMRSVKNGTAETGNEYSWAIKMVRSNGTIYDSAGEGVSYMQLSHDYFRGNDNAHHSFNIHLHNIHGASDYDYLQVTGKTAHVNQDGDQRMHGTDFHGCTHSNHAVNNGRTGIEFHGSHQNISGTWCTYGIK